MDLPSKEECYKLLKDYHVPQNVVEHSKKVAKVALFLADKLTKKGIEVNLELIEKASLLHDLVRICDFREFKKENFKSFGIELSDDEFNSMKRIRDKFKGTHHADACYDIFKGRYPELALVIKRHKYMYLLDEKNKPRTWEEKLVYYADKRVKHSEVVLLKDRLDDGERRNAHMAEVNHDTRGLIRTRNFELEKEIFNIIGENPEIVNKL